MITYSYSPRLNEPTLSLVCKGVFKCNQISRKRHEERTRWKMNGRSVKLRDFPKDHRVSRHKGFDNGGGGTRDGSEGCEMNVLG